MPNDGIACRILIQNEQLEQEDTFPYVGSLITEDGECTTKFRTGLNTEQAGARPEHHVWGGLEPRAWRAREREPITGVQGQSPWSGGQGGEAPLKLKTF